METIPTTKVLDWGFSLLGFGLVVCSSRGLAAVLQGVWARSSLFDPHMVDVKMDFTRDLFLVLEGSPQASRWVEDLVVGRFDAILVWNNGYPRAWRRVIHFEDERLPLSVLNILLIQHYKEMQQRNYHTIEPAMLIHHPLSIYTHVSVDENQRTRSMIDSDVIQG